MTHVTLSVIGLLLYWPVAVFIGHAETQHAFDPPTEAIVCHSLHPRPKPCGVWDNCQILLDQRMTITQTGVHIPPTAALEGSWPLSSGQVKKHRWLGAHTYCMYAHDTSVCCTITCDIVKCYEQNVKVWFIHKFIKYSKRLGLVLCCSLAFCTSTSFYNPFLTRERMSWSSRRRRGSVAVCCCLTCLCMPVNSQVHLSH